MAKPMNEYEKKILAYVKTLSLQDIKILTLKYFGTDLTDSFSETHAMIIYEYENNK